MPKTFDVEKLKQYSDVEIKNAVESEYSEDIYKQNERFLLNNWEKVSKEIEIAFSKSGLSCQEEYKIFLTKYGMGGSYNLPKTVIINLNKFF